LGLRCDFAKTKGVRAMREKEFFVKLVSGRDVCEVESQH
jgi:hypothetical protein